MLQLKSITKEYPAGDTTVHALKGVDLAFRDSEFVSILGPSGCGKTTLLNIIGGLDVYTSGDLVINGRSTKEFKAADWDTYRNHSVGFVFQSYNLIPHQTVLSNVELALTLSGVSKAERKKRATEALEKVGLGDQLHKKPNQMSGGQMQRVAIARALVNDPDILLADEPTGALDTETSVAVMEILKEISKDRLIIMVTHNPTLAEEYSTRIVNLLDGRITGDTDPFTAAEAEAAIPAARAKAEKEKAKGKKSMSFFTALSLSFNNLMTKRARTILTSFAGSIGIIGIALILAVSTGVNAYIASVQRDTLSSYPISILSQESDYSALLGGSSSEERPEHENDAVYSDPQLYQLFNMIFAADKKTNNLTAFKAFLDREINPATSTTGLYHYTSAIQYKYNLPLHCYVKNQEGKFITCDLGEAFDASGSTTESNEGLYNMLSSNLSMINLWQEMLSGKDGEPVSEMLFDQYDLIYGAWPEAADELVLVLNEDNEISDLAFYALGYMTEEEIQEMISAVLSGGKVPYSERKVSYEDILKIEMKLLLPSDYYTDRNGDGIFEYIGDDEAMMDLVIKNAYDLKIVGIVRPNEDATAGALSAPFGYTSALTDYIIEKNSESEVVKAQSDPANQNFDVLTGLPFLITEENDISDAEKAEKIKEYFTSLSDREKTELYITILSVPSEDYVSEQLDKFLAQYDTRDKMVALIAESFGMSVEQIEAYLSDYSDEELIALVTEELRKTILSAYASEVKNRVETIMNTPTEEELVPLVAQITGALTTREQKIAYIAADWASSTSLPQTTILAYLSALDDEALAEALNASASKAAAELYQSLSDLYADSRYQKIAALFDEEFIGETDVTKLAGYYDNYMPSVTSKSTLEENKTLLGIVDPATPSSINIYATTFENKDEISRIISSYNESVDEDDAIEYTDYIALLLSGVTKIINAISYVLIAFVSISLIVSSIMIGIITYISVLERTKEIGILRSIGASKHDVSLVFNAETIIVGLAAGLIGIGVSLLLCIPINLIIHALSGVSNLDAFLQPLHAVILVIISMALTMIAGLIPSRIAAKKDPVEALRTE